MPLPVLITLSLQKLIDNILAKSPKTQQKCPPLQDKVIQFHIQGVDANIYILVLNNSLEILSQYDYQPDVIFSGLPSGYIALSKNAKKALVDKVISVKGDFNVGQQFNDLIDSVEIDMASMFSSTIGDDLANHFFASNQPSIVSKVINFKQNQWKDILQNKLNVLPKAQEVNTHNQQVKHLAKNLQRLENTIQRLAGKN